MQGAVVLVVLEIAPAYEHQNVARLVIQPDYCALKIFGRGSGWGRAVCFTKSGCVLGISPMIIVGMLFDPLQIRSEGILSNLLKIDIDCCVNPKAFVHRAIPSHFGNYLLADVIDRVSLSLRVLPAPDDDLFFSGSGTSFAADKIKIAHPIQCVIAHFQ